MTRSPQRLVAPIFALQVAFFGFVALHRFVDGDEGLYLMASRSILVHKLPYLDFFYQQTPLLPFVYGAWMKMAGVSWVSAKMFAASLTALIGTLLYKNVCDETRSGFAGLSSVVIFASSTLIFAFLPLAKTYSLACLSLFSAYFVIGRLTTESSLWMIAAGGLLFGLGVDTRSYLVLTAPVVLWWLANSVSRSKRLISALSFLGGFVVAMIPCLYLFVCSPRAFLFDNLGYHSIRSDSGLIGKLHEKFVVLLLSFLGRTYGSNGIQLSLLVALSLGFLSLLRVKRSSARLALQMALVLGVISLLPTPAFPDYLCLCVPFLIVSCVCGAHDALITFGSRRERLFACAAFALVLFIYVSSSISDFRKYLVTGEGVVGAESSPDEADWRLQRVLEVSRAVDEIAAPGETVASFWPGHIFQTHAVPFPGLENDFALPIWAKLTPQQRSRYHILSPTEIEASFASHQPRVVVLRDQISYPVQGPVRKEMLKREDQFRRALCINGYIRVRSIGGVSIYAYPSKG